MTERGRRAGTRAGAPEAATRARAVVRLVTVVAVAAAMVVSAASLGAAGLAAGSPAGSGSIHYVTNSGFAVVDASGGALPNGSFFPDANTLALPGITLSANGTAAVTVDQRTGTETRLSGINATHNVTVDPRDKQTVVLGGGLTSLNFTAVGYDASNPGVDFTYTANSSATLTITGTGLSNGTTVEALNASTDASMATATIDANGNLTFTALPDGSHSIDLENPSTVPSTGGGRNGGSTPRTVGVTVTRLPSGSARNEVVPDIGIVTAVQRATVPQTAPGGDVRIDFPAADGIGAAPRSVDNVTGGSGGSQAANVVLDGVDVRFWEGAEMNMTVVTGELPPENASGGGTAMTALPQIARNFTRATGRRPLGFVHVRHTVNESNVRSAFVRFSVRSSYLTGKGGTEANLTLYRRGTDGWRALDTVPIGETDGYYHFRATSPGLSLYAIGTDAPVFVIDNTSETVDAETRTVTVTGRVTNVGSVTGNDVVPLRLDGAIVNRTTVSLPPHGSTSVTLAASSTATGPLSVSLGGRDLEAVVLNPTTTATAPKTTTQTTTPKTTATRGDGSTSSGSGAGGFSLLAAVLAVALAIGRFVRRGA